MAFSLEQGQAGVKPMIEFFSCGHAHKVTPYNPMDEEECRWRKESLLNTYFTWDLALMPSQSFHIFTDSPCKRPDCTLPAGFVHAIESTATTQSRRDEDQLRLSKGYAQYRSRLAEVGRRLALICKECLTALPGLGVPHHSGRLDRLFELFPGCFSGDSVLNEAGLQVQDIEELMGRICAEASTFPPFAKRVATGLAQQQLGVLLRELSSLEQYVHWIEQLEVIMWETDTFRSDLGLSEEGMKLARQTKATDFFKKAPAPSSETAIAAGQESSDPGLEEFDIMNNCSSADFERLYLGDAPSDAEGSFDLSSDSDSDDENDENDENGFGQVIARRNGPSDSWGFEEDRIARELMHFFQWSAGSTTFVNISYDRFAAGRKDAPVSPSSSEDSLACLTQPFRQHGLASVVAKRKASDVPIIAIPQPKRRRFA